jgi:hypothetical protein
MSKVKMMIPHRGGPGRPWTRRPGGGGGRGPAITGRRPTRRPPNRPSGHVADFEAVAGVFKTRAAATKTAAKGHEGLHRRKRVARPRLRGRPHLPTLAAARTEQAALQKDGFNGAIKARGATLLLWTSGPRFRLRSPWTSTGSMA